MSVIATAVKHMLAAGITGEALVAAIAEMEACVPVAGKDATAARRREKDAAYQAAKRAERKTGKTSARRQKSSDSADSADVGAPFPNDIYSNPLPEPLVISDEITVPASILPMGDQLDQPQAEAPLTPDEVLEAWNDMAGRHGLPKAKLTPARRKALAVRIRQHSLEDFTEAIRAVPRSPFLLGENQRGWRADFDFFLQPTSFTKLIEGSYDRGDALTA
ncbi:hypothetical protein MOP88_14030 [Sphingomonas sp. WKB10]|nr:hypothetical protein [Sphingomonas sp. WKB10]